jgi:dTDP-4-amino-4,6-dideoxygalactose transaminase
MSLPSRNTNPERLNSSSFEWRVPLSAPSFSEQEIQEVGDVLKSGWWTYGPISRALECEFAARLGVRHAIAVANGTAALHLAYLALELSQDQEVLTPSLTFVAAANTLLHAGGIPRFVDVASLDLPLVTVDTLESMLSPKTRGICVMHYGGYPCAMDEIMEFARRHHLWVIEDAAHSLGGVWQGKSCGAWGDVSCFSFFGNKNLTCGEGGMVVTERDDLADKLRALRSHGMSSLTWDRYQGHNFSYDVQAAGLNYRIDDLRAALLRVQLRNLERINRLRQERVDWYRRLLGNDNRWTIPFENHAGISAYHLFVIVLGKAINRDPVMNYLKEEGIQTSIHYPPIHRFSFYRNLSGSCSDLGVTEALGSRLLTLPLFPDMTYEQVKMVADSLCRAVDAEAGHRI